MLSSGKHVANTTLDWPQSTLLEIPRTILDYNWDKSRTYRQHVAVTGAKEVVMFEYVVSYDAGPGGARAPDWPDPIFLPGVFNDSRKPIGHRRRKVRFWH